MSKLKKFRPYLQLEEAAEWLGSMIDEHVSQDDLWRLNFDGHLSLIFCGGEGNRPMVGLPVMAPPPTASDDPWKIIFPAGSGSDIHQAVYADYLHYPISIIITDLGATPALLVDGFPYAWFMERSLREIPKSISDIYPLELERHDLHGVFPGDILRLAQCANSDEPAARLFDTTPEHRVWSYASNMGRIYLKSCTLEVSPAITTPCSKPETPSTTLAVAALLELLKRPVDRARPQGMNQEAIKAEILTLYPWRGLSDRNLQTIFAAANKAKSNLE